MRLYRILLGLGVAAVLFSGAAEARSVKQLVMPGEVIKGHAKYENECSRCHRYFSKTSQKSLCLDCHKKVSADVKKKRGFHGRSKDVKAEECKHCHTEHKGRGARVVLLDEDVFDHRVTDFKLKGVHVKRKCVDCHKPKKKYREAPSACIKCHKDNDVHKGRLGKKCADCHRENNWKKARYDHDETDFPLKESHKKVACIKCHLNERYKKTPKDCYTCHKFNDVHNGSYGKKCADCHRTKEWKSYKFDHDKTDFPLKFKHEKVDCYGCHSKRFYKEKVPKTCHGCHKNDDVHKGRYGKKCKNCHTPKEWKKYKFDHDKTDFPLKFKHEKVDCNACHRGRAYEEELGTTCYECHKPDDVHRTQEGKRCESCHNERGWMKKVFFNHDITRFPLIGLHAIAPCEGCHAHSAYKDTPLECVKCHKPDDKHKQGLGVKCGPCHNPNGWKLWRYDHDKETDFKLDGAHKGLVCESCHDRPVKKVTVKATCYSCHQDDDIHRGNFGFNCARCHVTKAFEEIEIKH